ncbi:shikimate dehydrogenase family protein [Leucobacter chromiiresistens]|uniref:Shikimate dehydrogenase n=1 Tax=Leucobacter chromiiresistens TaxID=1079994 RepID=A0A147EQM5_9MICO|nr:shikimate dehydrogenase [Leucobacter chromiiresistens]KTR86848.1 shikimate dehydrogenase [Leucobacter chromiiresistens]
MTARLAVLGSPIAHSRSPRIHAAAYRELGLDWRYSAVRCGEQGLAPFLRGRGAEWRGFSVTMPLKVEAHRIAGELDAVAAESGVVNTLLRRENGDWFGANTDVPGLSAAMAHARLDPRSTVVLGSGATAVSAILAARGLGAERITLLARNADAGRALVDRFTGTRAAPDAAPMEVVYGGDGTEPSSVPEARTLVVSALPGPAAARVLLPQGLTGTPLFDVAYDPWPSPLAARWCEAGGEAHPGTEMLVEQALVQVRIFVHGDPTRPLDDEAAVRSAMRRAV